MFSRNTFYSYTGLSTPFDPTHRHITSPLLSTQALAGVRLLLAFYTLFTLLFTLIWTSVREHGGSGWFSYFTHLSYIGLCAYFFAAGTHTFVFSREPLDGSSRSYLLERWPRALQFLHLVLEASSVYPHIAWTNISVHILNLVFAVFEILFTNIPPAPWLTLPCCIIILGCYLGVAYITHATQGFYRTFPFTFPLPRPHHSLRPAAYAFLDPAKPRSPLPAWILGILAAYMVVFLIVRGIMIFRIRVVSWAGARAGVVPSEAMEDWETVERPSKEGRV
ncbi:hypothetical protein H0H87_007422 [Tephrocybe sp. NHM501043]|nr:hypothetical protein H0H87_007422 [Tephrocybe sp. NHM501043]